MPGGDLRARGPGRWGAGPRGPHSESAASKTKHFWFVNGTAYYRNPYGYYALADPRIEGLRPAGARAARPVVLVISGAPIVGVAQWLLAAIRGGRLPDAQVTDYPDPGSGPSRWPTFNIADAAITIGLAILIWNSFRGEPHLTDAP